MTNSLPNKLACRCPWKCPFHQLLREQRRHWVAESCPARLRTNRTLDERAKPRPVLQQSNRLRVFGALQWGCSWLQLSPSDRSESQCKHESWRHNWLCRSNVQLGVESRSIQSQEKLRVGKVCAYSHRGRTAFPIEWGAEGVDYVCVCTHCQSLCWSESGCDSTRTNSDAPCKAHWSPSKLFSRWFSPELCRGIFLPYK